MPKRKDDPRVTAELQRALSGHVVNMLDIPKLRPEVEDLIAGGLSLEAACATTVAKYERGR